MKKFLVKATVFLEIDVEFEMAAINLQQAEQLAVRMATQEAERKVMSVGPNAYHIEDLEIEEREIC